MDATTQAAVASGRTFLTDRIRAAIATGDAVAPAIARVFLGVVMLPHGAQKTLGWFDGFGYAGTMGFFTETIGLPWWLAFVVIATESVGALALIAGFAGRLFAALTGAIMIGAVVTTHGVHGFFMNWYGTQAGEGYEFHLLALGLALVVTVAGSGAASVDRVLTGRLR